MGKLALKPTSRQMDYLLKLSSDTAHRAEVEEWTGKQVSTAIDRLKELKAASTGHQKSEPREVQPLAAFDFVDLLQEECEPLQWIIPDYLPEGLTLLFARPKVGKSMLALALSLRMARRVSGGVDGTVLYLSLDDTSRRRLQSRTRSLLQGNEIEGSRVWGAMQSQSLENGLVEQLALWMEEHPHTRLIVIDVYARVKPKKQDDDVYKSDYDALVKLQEFAVRHHIAIILVHHTRKQRDTADWIDNVNGSTGLTAAVDTIWMLERSRGSTNLRLLITGRDVIENAIVLSLDDLDGPWDLEQGGGQDVNTTEQKIIDVLQPTDEELTPRRITELTALKHATVLGTLRRMLAKNLVAQTTYGSYRITRITELQDKKPCNSVILVIPDAEPASPEWVADYVPFDPEPVHSNGNGYLPPCPSCKTNKRVHHIEMNEYGCNTCGHKFYS